MNVPKRFSAQEDKFEVFTNDEIEIIRREISETKKYFIFMFALLTGMRQGEILALNISDIDMENKTINVTKSARHESVMNEDGTRQQYERIIQLPKSKASIRNIPFPESMMSYLVTTHVSFTTV